MKPLPNSCLSIFIPHTHRIDLETATIEQIIITFLPQKFDLELGRKRNMNIVRIEADVRSFVHQLKMERYSSIVIVTGVRIGTTLESLWYIHDTCPCRCAWHRCILSRIDNDDGPIGTFANIRTS